MLKAEQVPDEAYETASRIEDKNDIGAVILAAINAWPGMSTGPNIYGRQDAVMRLPLPTENTND